MDYIDSKGIIYTQKHITKYSSIKNLGFEVSSGVIVSKFLSCYSSYSFNQVIPKKITINDSLNTSITGSNMDALFGLDLFNKSQKIDIALLLGFEFGRLRLYGNSLLRKKNGYFATKIEIRPKFKINKLVIGGSFGYAYDISNPNWKNTWFSKDNSYSLNQLKQNGYSWQVFLGWSFN